MSIEQKLDGFFHITERNSSVKTEIRAGIITFLTMSYIMIVNPTIMAESGMVWSHVFTATAISAVAATLVMGLYAKYPIVQAPGMGINAFFTYTVVLTLGYTWEQALAAVFLSGILFLLMSIGGMRKKILETIPRDFRIAVTAGIGCFIAFVGLQGAGIIVPSPTLVSLGDFSDPFVLLALFGIILTLALHFLRISGGLIFGILITAVVGIVFGLIDLPSSVVSMPAQPDIGAFLTGLRTADFDITYFMVILSFLFVSFFDSAGTILAVGDRAGLTNEKGEIQGGNRALTSDAFGSVVGACVGVSPVTSFIESTAGIESGGRTGLMAVVVAVLFAVTVFFGPVMSVITFQCTVGVLIVVGACMMSDIGKIDWKDPVIALTSMMTILMTVLTYSITNGIALGMITYCLGMVLTKRMRAVSPVLYVTAAVLVFYFAFSAVLV